MSQEQTKKYILNIVTGVMVFGVVVSGYFVFRGKQAVTPSVGTTPTNEASLAGSAAETITIGADIEHTVNDIQELKNSIESSVTVFNLPAFKNLRDFSTTIPSEPVGRKNPFLPTDWSLKIKAVQDASRKQGGSTQSYSAGSLFSK